MTDKGWVHFLDREKSTILCFSTNEVASFRLHVHCNPDGEQVVVVISLERRCPEAYRQSMFEIVNYLNSKLVVTGFFAVDPRDGEVRYRQSQYVAGLEITPDFVDAFLKIAIGYAKKHYNLVQRGMLGYSLQGAREQ